MSSLTENIAQAISDFTEIKSAIIDKGVAVPSGTPTSRYADLIGQISSGTVVPKPIYGVSGLYQSSPLLTRTDDAVGLDYVINSSSGAIDSDFDDVFPWNETEVVQETAGKFLKFPEMYFRVGTDSEQRITDIAVSKSWHSEGNWYKVKPFMYACYGASISSNQLVSASNATRAKGIKMSQFRTYAQNSGNDYYQLDLYHHTVLIFLWLIEWATKNGDMIMKGRIKESGTQGGTSVQPTGGTDSLTSPSGFETDYNQMRYHYIEDFFGNLMESIEGVYCSPIGTPAYVTADPTSFSDDIVGKKQLNYPSPAEGLLRALGWDCNHPFLCMPIETVDEYSYSTYFCDKAMNYNSNYNYRKLICGAGYTFKSEDFGLASYMQLAFDNTGSYIGARLLKKL